MSNLNSLFDTLRGWPAGSALSDSFKPKAAEELAEGKVVKTESRAIVGTTGHTVEDPAVGAVNDVFVDPAVATDFTGVTSALVLDTSHCANADMLTVPDGKTIFDVGVGGYAGSKALLGLMGKKRLRVAVADAFATKRDTQEVDYAVRAAILKAEGATPDADTDAGVVTDSGGKVLITDVGEFATVVIGDVAHITVTSAGAYLGGYLVTARSNDTITLNGLAYSAPATVTVQCYSPGVTGGTKAGATCNAVAHTIADGGAAGTVFANAATGDVVFIIADSNEADNIGMWVIKTVSDANTVIVYDGTYDLLDSAAGADIIVFSPVHSFGATVAIAVRKRLTRLTDANQSFLNSIEVGDLINIPFPAEVDAAKWDTTTVKWPVASVADDNTLDATLTALEELGPELFIAGFNGDCPYRIDNLLGLCRITALTSAAAQHTDGSMKAPDQPWLVIQGNDQSDANFVEKCTCVKLLTGIVFKVATLVATFIPGDLVYANAGVLAEVTRTATIINNDAYYSNHKQPVGMVLEYNATDKYVIVAS